MSAFAEKNLLEFKMPDTGHAGASSHVATVVAFDKDRPFPAKLVERRRLSKPGSAKDIEHVVVDLSGSGLQYKTGDSLGVYATNDVRDVEALLSALKLTGSETVTLAKEGAVPLRVALLTKLALAQPAKKVLLAFGERATDAAEKATLEGLLQGPPEALKAFLDSRDVLDLAQAFPSARFSAQDFVDAQKRLAPRLYSIASSPVVHPSQVHLTVGVLRVEAHGRARLGVASGFLGARATVGVTPVPVFVASSHFGLPENGDTDVIMVGPGTGIAPFRAFVQERVATGARGRLWLFFGDQHRETDYLYQEEWEALQRDGKLARVDLAFSRDQDYKIYVQDRMREQAAELWRWLQGGASFYVCGDARRMAKDVDAMLHRIAQEQGGMSEAEAAEYVKGLKKAKRYQRDVY